MPALISSMAMALGLMVMLRRGARSRGLKGSKKPCFVLMKVRKPSVAAFS